MLIDNLTQKSNSNKQEGHTHKNNIKDHKIIDGTLKRIHLVVIRRNIPSAKY
ncbi:hypothetical protein XA3_18650 [Xylocopilactobacillus apicola]|uniref:Transposase n=1 Tax=Xylocopilactobacillus apicola TaxID=2932184 RepID=A0AAU9D6G1_9LACO|nr:hypothetical protein XA3_18650 [Xylocopilactobacillus apicola]